MDIPPQTPQPLPKELFEPEKKGGSFKLGFAVPLACVVIGLLLHVGQIVAPVLFCSPVIGLVLAILPPSRNFGLGIFLGSLVGWMLIIPTCANGIKGIN
jgi:hypothetical protein